MFWRLWVERDYPPYSALLQLRPGYMHMPGYRFIRRAVGKFATMAIPGGQYFAIWVIILRPFLEE